MRLLYCTLIAFYLFPRLLFAQEVDTLYLYNPNSPIGPLDIRVSKWPGQYYYLREDTTFSFRESSPGVITNTYQDMTSWDSSPFKQGHLRDKNGAIDNFVMNYRIMPPVGYNASYSPGYPMIVMMHGAGERGNCWDNNCFFATTSWNPVTNSPAAPTTVDHQLLNNDYNLAHGGLPHLNAVNLAGNKLPDDPTLNTRAFPGFVLFPQNLNGWGANPAQDVIRIVRLLCRKYNIDKNRIYVHGLSNGGMGTYDVIKRAPWLFTAALPMSAIGDAEIVFRNYQAEVGKLPLWIFQGGQDTNPTPTETFALVKKFREAGAVVRYNLYPSLGHGTWNTAYAEPDFFTWMLSKRKYNPHIFFGNPSICGPTQAGVKMGFSKGFLGYQWERDGAIIPGATEAEYTATIPGTYRARFSRVLNPTEAQWERWSDPIIVTELNPEKPVVEVTGSTHLRGPGQANVDANNTVILKSKNTADVYKWYFKQTMNADGTITSSVPSVLISNDTVRTLKLIKNNNVSVGTYTLVTENANCPSPPADSVYLFFNNQPGTANIPAVGTNINTLGINFSGLAMSPTSVLLTWNDKVNSEKGYEIWRRKGPASPTEFKFVGRTGEDGVSFLDTNLDANTSYEYKLRAINNKGRSNYIPGNFDADLVNNYQISTPPDTYPPSAPQNLTYVSNTNTSISLTWQAATDDGGIKEYYVYYSETDSVSTGGAVTSFTLSGIAPSTTYLIRVKAVDASNRFSPASNQIVATTYLSGLTYTHSTGAWTDLDEATMVAKFLNPEFTGTISNFSLSPRTQEDFFNFQFIGNLYIVNAGTYQFRTTSDDGSRLTLNNTMIVNNDGLHGNVTVTSTNQTLSAGTHTIDVKFFEYNGGQSLTVEYKGPDTGNSWIVIPNTALQNAPYIPGAPAAMSSPTNLTAAGTGMQQVNLNWQPGALENVNGFKIVILGSSTAVGTGSSPVSNSWVELLKTYFTNEQVTNLAVGGYTTRDIMPTGSPSPATPKVANNITAALALQPHLIIVNMPTNDVNNSVPMAETMANYRTLKALTNSYGVKLLVTTTQPRNLSTSALRTLLDTQGDSIRNVFGSNTIDIYDELTDFSNSRRIKASYNSGDGIHLNNAGHNYIYLTARTKVLEYVQLLTASPKYEVFRSLNSSGPYNIIKTTSQLSHIDDVSLNPGTIYYYKVRTLYSNGGLSSYSNIASDTTFGDPIAPTVPTLLQLIKKTYTNAVFSWTASTDNIGVTGYEVFANGNLIGTSPVHSYTASNLTPNTNYTFTVKAFDAQGNRSLESAPLAVITNTPATYYSVNGGNLNLLDTWKENPDGSGNSPASFNNNGQYYVVNNTATSLGGPWNISGLVSKVIVPSGVTLTVDNPILAKIDLEGTATLNLNHTTAPELLSISPTSTINFNSYSSIPRNTYGNINLTGSGNKTFSADSTTILGNLTVANNIALKGAADNSTVLKVSGNITVNGGTDITAADNRINLYFTGSGTKNLTVDGNLYLYKVGTSPATSLDITNSGTPSTLYLGSLKGGGLLIPGGSTLNIGNNNLELEYAATINSSNEPGKIGINGGDIDLTSTSNSNSNLYFSNVNNVIKRFSINLSGTGDVFFREPALVTDALKITRGEIQAGGNLTLTSTETKTANLEEIENSGVITGDVNVQRYFNPKGRIYRYLSTPVANTSIADWQANFPITGVFTGASTGPGLGIAPSIFHYDESGGGWLPFPTPGSDNQVLLERGKGYSVFMRNATTPLTAQVAGNPYQGNIPFNLDGGTGGNDGWNLVGNPYASTIVWSNNSEAWIKSGINPVISIKDNPSGQYRYYDADNNVGDLTAGKIAPGQGFWVKAINGSPSLTITEKAKLNDQQTFYREDATTAKHLIVNLVQGLKADPAYILFTDQGTDSYDKHADGIKQPNEGMFNLSSKVSSGVDLAVNNLSDGFCSKTVTLNIANAAPGSYKLAFENLQNLSGVGQITLTDNFTGTVTPVNSAEYLFSITSDTRSTGAERFSLTFTRPSLTLTAEPVATDVCGTEYAAIKLQNTQADVDYVVTNDSGETLSAVVTARGNEATLIVHKSKLQAGDNSFRIKAGFKGCDTHLLPATATVRYTEAFYVSAPDFLSVCQGSGVTLSASGAPALGRYKWFNENGHEIATTQSSYLQVPAIRSETAYFVSATHPNGCESTRKAIHIVPETLDTPVLTFSEGILYTDAVNTLQWKKDGELIQDARKTQFKPTVSGVYSVEVYSGGCIRESLPFEYLVTGTEAPHDTEFGVQVFPVPASSHNIHVKISSDVNAPVQLDLVDPLGKNHFNRIYEPVEIKGSVKITPLDLQDGFYFIIVKQGNKTLKKKIVVKN